MDTNGESSGEQTSWDKLKRARKADHFDQLEQEEDGLELASAKRRRESEPDDEVDDAGEEKLSTNGILDSTSPTLVGCFPPPRWRGDRRPADEDSRLPGGC